MEKYLQAVLEQIRCKKVHPYIREELMGHIQDQIEDNRKSGMSEKEAEEAAVRDMGDPVEIGVEFDRIHRPQIAWKMLIVIGVISVLGILVHFFITRQIADSNLWDSSVSGSSRYALHVLIGLALMFVVYRIDYTYLAKYAKVIAACISSFWAGMSACRNRGRRSYSRNTCRWWKYSRSKYTFDAVCTHLCSGCL